MIYHCCKFISKEYNKADEIELMKNNRAKENGTNVIQINIRYNAPLHIAASKNTKEHGEKNLMCAIIDKK